MDIEKTTITFNVNVIDIWNKLSIVERYALMERELRKLCPIIDGKCPRTEFAEQCYEIIKCKRTEFDIDKLNNYKSCG